MCLIGTILENKSFNGILRIAFEISMANKKNSMKCLPCSRFYLR